MAVDRSINLWRQLSRVVPRAVTFELWVYTQSRPQRVAAVRTRPRTSFLTGGTRYAYL